MDIKLVLSILFLTINVSALPVSVILQDNVRIENNTVIHSITTFKDVQNVTIRDYFSEVDVVGIGTGREKFLGREWNSVRFEIGAMNSGDSKIITYEILSGNGTALLGADTYYIDGEFHQLFPKETVIDIRNRTIEKIGDTVWFAIIAIVIISIVIYMKIRKS